MYAEICCCTYVRARPIVTECGTFHKLTQIRCPDKDLFFVMFLLGICCIFSLHAFDAQMCYSMFIL